MADSFVQGSFAFTCTSAEAALIEESWQHAADVLGDYGTGMPSPEFLAAFPPTDRGNLFSGLTAIFCDAAFPDFGAEIEISDATECTVSIYSLTDFQPDPIAELIRRCCRQTLSEAPIGFDWSFSCSRPYRDSFGGGWCAIFPDHVVFVTTADALKRTLDEGGSALAAMPPDPWAEDPRHPLADWKLEIANDDTRLGYRDWVNAQLTTAGDGS